MKRVVVFTSNNARILTVSDDVASQMAGRIDTLVDPDLSAVKGIPPHLWKLVSGSIVPMGDKEQTVRVEHIARTGADNNIIPITQAMRKPSVMPYFVYGLLASIGTVGVAILLLLLSGRH